MGRRPRFEEAGAIHHVWSRGNNKEAIFFGDEDREEFLDLLGREVRERQWSCLAYCLMGNHFHLLVQTPEADLGRGMHRLLTNYVRRVHRREERINHLFGGRYGSAREWTDTRVLTRLGYIAHNPVAAGLCGEAREWRWGSYRLALEGTAGPLIDVARLAEFVDVPDGYRRLVEAWWGR